MWTTAGTFVVSSQRAYSTFGNKLLSPSVAWLLPKNLKQSHVSTSTSPKTTATLSFVSLFSILIFLCAWTSHFFRNLYLFFCCCCSYRANGIYIQRRQCADGDGNLDLIISKRTGVKCLARVVWTRLWFSRHQPRNKTTKKWSQKRKWEKLEHATQVH